MFQIVITKFKILIFQNHVFLILKKSLSFFDYSIQYSLAFEVLN